MNPAVAKKNMVSKFRVAAARVTGMRVCTDAVAYAFLGHNTGQLKHVWNYYFSTCPFGSHTIVVHSQGGTFDVANATILSKSVAGELRFKYGMVEAMLLLFRAALSEKTAKQCTPGWVQLLSDTSVPLAPCAQVHAFLGHQVPRSSLMTLRGHKYVQRRRPVRFQNQTTEFLKADQWVTLTSDDAALLLERTDLHEEWKHTFCPDEHMVPNIMRELGRPIRSPGIHWVNWLSPSHLSHGHPPLLDCDSCRSFDAASVVDKPDVRDNVYFVRKIGETCAESALHHIHAQRNASRICGSKRHDELSDGVG